MEQEHERPLSRDRRRFYTSVGLVTVVGLVAATAVSAVVGISYIGQGEVDFDKIKVIDSVKVMKSIQNPTSGKPVKVKDDFTVTGKTNAVGVIQNTTPGKSVKIDDKLIVTGAANFIGVLRNTATDKPVKVDDDLQVTGALTAGSITGLSSLVSAAGFVQTNDLSVYAKTSDLSAYAKLTDLSSYATTSTVNALSDTVDILINNTNVLYNYNRCVLNLGQYGTYPTIDDMLFCWSLYVGTDLGVPAKIGSGPIVLPQANQEKVQLEMDRVAATNK